jgi:hypothetical protein
MQVPTNETATSLQIPVMKHNQQAIDLTFSSSSPHHDDVQYGGEVLDLRVCRSSETIVKQECCTGSDSPVVIMNHHQPSTSAFHPSVPYSHIPLHKNVKAYPQPPDTVPHASKTVSPVLVSSTIPVQSSSVISLQTVPIPSTSGDSLQIPCLPQYMLYHHTPSTEVPSNLQLDSSPENSLSSNSFMVPSSPASAPGLQPPPFPLLHQVNSLPSIPISNSVVGNQAKKCTRPFKAVSFALGEVSALYSESFGHFKEEVYARAKLATENSKKRKKSPALTHPSSPQPSSSTSEQSPPSGKDAAYLAKRRKNNEAAKRSRDARRAKEDELALWKEFLERENQRLRYELMMLMNNGVQVVDNNCVCTCSMTRT